jgi:hypothetical protein
VVGLEQRGGEAVFGMLMMQVPARDNVVTE